MLPYLFKNGVKKLVVVCYEAGAAQIISSLVKNKIFYQDISFCLDGPAKNIFKDKVGEIEIKNNFDEISSLGAGDFVLAGRSLVPDFEREAILMANKYGIDNGVFLDHWVNFDNFYIPHSRVDSKSSYPDYMPKHVFVGDKYAFGIAEKLYGEKVMYIENEYHIDILECASRFESSNHNNTLLYIADPLSDDNKKLNNGLKIYNFDEFDVFTEMMNNIDLLKNIGISKIVVRFHPNHVEQVFAENILNKIRYDNDIEIVVDGKTELVRQIMNSRIVFGIESAGLVISQMLGKATYSFVPEYGTKRIVFPHKEIIKIRSFSELKGV